MSKSRHLLDPQLVPSLALLQPRDFAATDLTELRAVMRDALLKQLPPPAPDILIEERSVRAGGHATNVRIYRPAGAAAPAGAVLDIHGGGFVIGCAELNEVQNCRLAGELGCVIVAPRYRLAPETRYPGPVEDCYSALLWLFENAGEIGVDPDRIVVMGGSAGGGLAAGTALLARDRGRIKPAAQILLWPMLDDRTCIATDLNPFVGEFCWTPEDNRFGWQALLGVEPGSEGVSAYAAPARAELLEGLPRTFLAVPTLDLFLDENMDFARRLMRSGVATELHVLPGAFHGFARFAPDAEVSRVVDADIRRFLKRALNTGTMAGVD